MKKLYQAKLHTEEQLDLSGVRYLERIEVLDIRKRIKKINCNE